MPKNCFKRAHLSGTLLDYDSSENDLGVIVNTALTFDDQCNDRYSIL